MEYIGIDIGGTNIRIGGINNKEELIFEYQENTLENVITSEDLYLKIKKLIKMVPNYKDCKAIGIGAPGSVSKELGQVTISRNLSILNNFPLVERLTQDFNKPIFLENDAVVAAFAEASKGKGKNKKIVCYITISTGVGGSIIIDKNIYSGSNNLGIFFSRIILDGKNNSNSLISGKALLKQANEKLDKKIKNASKLFELEEINNLIAEEIIKKFKNNLTTLLLNISAIINPDIIILGGGVMKSKDKFLPEVIENFKNKAHPLAKDLIIETVQFKEPGIIGAALLAKNIYNSSERIK